MHRVLFVTIAVLAPAFAAAQDGCGPLPDTARLQELLHQAPKKTEAGGLMHGRMEWAAVVDRGGRVCALAVAADDPAAAWPGSRGIALAKAYTANAFSTDEKPMSTARLYTLSQPGHSLWQIGAGNPLDPACLAVPGQGNVRGRICGGTIAFAGGLPLYRDGKRVGGLGVSGDTACADHEIAKVVRAELGMNPPKGKLADDVVYVEADGPSIYAHSLCPNTWRNGKRIGDEAPASEHMKQARQ